ncbi:hypothetical protein TNCV_882551 [Trichonephila clavipes]|nr:hypothetical protein TNCV_882551 [Trichonephila clavipes]
MADTCQWMVSIDISYDVGFLNALFYFKNSHNRKPHGIRSVDLGSNVRKGSTVNVLSEEDAEQAQRSEVESSTLPRLQFWNDVPQ